MALCISVPKKEAQAALQWAREHGFFCGQHGVGRAGERVLIPLRSSGQAPARKQGYEVVRAPLPPAPARAGGLGDLLKGALSPQELEDLGSSFDIVGDIAVLELSPSLAPQARRIAQALLDSSPALKVVAQKAGGTGGPYRIRPVEVIAGERRTRTVAKENGCRLALDLNEAYYTPRFATERLRIAKQVKAGERVLALFAGIGPYPLVIEKKAPQVGAIRAVELNPQAVKWMRENIAANKCKRIEIFEADAHEFLARPLARAWADRILMPHPSDALAFLPGALGALKPGGLIHLYGFGPRADPIAALMAQASEVAASAGFDLERVGGREVRPFSASTVQVVLDLRARPSKRS